MTKLTSRPTALLYTMTFLGISISGGACSTPEPAPTDTPTLPSTSKAVTTPPPEATAPLRPSKTPSPTPTYTPIPTLTLEEANAEILRLLDTNGGCLLPCIWRLTPGVTNRAYFDLLYTRFPPKYAEDHLFIGTNRFRDGDLGGITWISRENNLRLWVAMGYYFHGQDRLKFVGLGASSHQIAGSGIDKELHYLFGNPELLDLVDQYTLSTVLNEYGPPPKVLIAPEIIYYPPPPVRQDWLWFSVVLIYEDQGILAEYIMPRRMIGDYYAGCMHQLAEMSIVGWDPEQPPDLSEIASLTTFLGIGKTNVDRFKPLEVGGSMSIHQFVETFKDPGSKACVFTPMEMWPDR